MITISIDKMIDGTFQCPGCGDYIGELDSFQFTGIRTDYPTHTDEVNKCSCCGTEFIARYAWFDDDGHVSATVFSEDPNDQAMHWSSMFTLEQQRAIQGHIRRCALCQGREIESILENADSADLIRSQDGLHARCSPEMT